MKQIFKYIIFGLLLLFLFHFESTSLGPLKVSHIWKAVLIFLLVMKLKTKDYNFYVYKPFLFISLLQLINYEIVEDPIIALVGFGTNLIVPLCAVYFYRFPLHELKHLLLFFTSFYILSFLPYQFGLLESLKSGYTLENYGSDILGVIGPFQTVHAASLTLGAAFVVIFYFVLDKTYNKIYLYFLLGACFYFLFNTYVRTGMAMAIIGILPIIYFFSKGKVMTKVRLLILGSLLAIMSATWVISNPVLVNRIIGQTERSNELDSFDTMGSGRGALWQYAAEVYLEYNLVEKIIGTGQTETLKRMSGKKGSGVVPHNGFLQILLINGLLGFLCLIFLIKNIFKLRKKLSPKYKTLILALLSAYVIMCLFQSYDLLYVHILLILAITLNVKKSYLEQAKIEFKRSKFRKQ